MRFRSLLRRILFFIAACLLGCAQAFAQQPVQPQGPDVVRVNTALVQTDVMVFDKQGNFVDGLKRDQFLLKVDGKPRDISFFERVVAGSRNEEAQLAAARGNSTTRAGNPGAIPLDRGRTMFFFVDDLHLSPGSLKQARLLLQNFIDREMGQNDEAVIASTSGQIGFLQQLTDDKSVLRAAAERLISKTYTARDTERPPMSAYQAQLIEAEHYDVLEYFIDELIRIEGNIPRSLAADQIHGRASQIVQQTALATNSTLNSMMALVKTAGAVPGRKLLFLISDGFLLDNNTSDSYERVRQVTNAATAAGVVIYSIDARGLFSGTPDASSDVAFDPGGRLTRSAGGEIGASQDGLSALAADTGGRAFFNNNNLAPAVRVALKETSTYYLLAWRPESEEQPTPKSRRIEVSVSGRPELSVRFHRGFGGPAAAESTVRKKKEGAAKPTEDLISSALRAPYPKNDLPVAVSLHFLDVAQVGSTLTTSIRVSTGSLVLEAREGTPTAEMDVAGGVFDDQGKPVSTFNKHLTLKPKAVGARTSPPESVFYNHFCVIKPGLYQVRVAALDPKRSRVGSAVRWIEIPDLGSKALTLSSLIVGERKTEATGEASSPDEAETGKAAGALRQVSLNVDHHFSSSSLLRFLTFVYNANSAAQNTANQTSPDVKAGKSVPASSIVGGANGPDLAVQVQVFRDNEPVVTTPLHKIQVEGATDLRRLPYAAELTLAGLQPGRYVLIVTVIDRLAKASAAQRFSFQVD